MYLLVIWPDGQRTREHIDRFRGLTRVDASGERMRPKTIIADTPPSPEILRSPHLLARTVEKLKRLGATSLVAILKQQLESAKIYDCGRGSVMTLQLGETVMNAETARRITQSAKPHRAILDNIDSQIEAAARAGKSRIAVLGIDGDLARIWIDDRVQIRKHYELLGFTWTEHPDPDPGHPCSRPYVEMSW